MTLAQRSHLGTIRPTKPHARPNEQARSRWTSKACQLPLMILFQLIVLGLAHRNEHESASLCHPKPTMKPPTQAVAILNTN